jgi:DNA invertase Pin-like site-specific DNA recombinase
MVAALAACRRLGAGLLVAAKRDRIARDPLVTAAIERAAAAGGTRVASADGLGNGDSPGDRLVRGVVDAVADFELAIIQARTRDALAAKRARGEACGGATPRYGFRFETDAATGRKLLVPVGAEQRAIRLAGRHHADGRSLRWIATRLAATGLLSRSGKPFSASQVARMIERAAADAARDDTTL